MHRPVDAKKENDVEADGGRWSIRSRCRADWVASVPLIVSAAWTPLLRAAPRCPLNHQVQLRGSVLRQVLPDYPSQSLLGSLSLHLP